MLQMLVLSSFVLATAQGLVESRLNPWAVGKANERGAWQVIEKYHGKVPATLPEQFCHYAKIMDGLRSAHHTEEKAIERYNGKGKKAKRYLALVQKKALEITLLGV